MKGFLAGVSRVLLPEEGDGVLDRQGHMAVISSKHALNNSFIL